MSRLGILSNATSGGNRTGIDAINSLAKAANVPHIVTRSITEVEPALRSLAATGVDVLAINGGDGTLSAALSRIRTGSIFSREPIFALLRGGTTNMVHRDAGLRGTPARALRRLIEVCRWGSGERPIVSRPVIRVQGSGGNDAAHGFFFGAAAIPRAILLTRHRMHPSGLTGPAGESVAVAWLLLRLLSARVEDDPVLHPDDIAYALDGEDWRQDRIVLLMTTTLHRLILGLRPVGTNGGLGFAALTWPYRRLWRTLPLFFGRRVGARSGNGLVCAHAQQIALRVSGSYVLDGEIFPADAAAPLHLKVGAPARFLVI